MARRDQEEDELKRKRRIDNSTLYSPVSNDKVFVLFCFVFLPFPSLPYDMTASFVCLFGRLYTSGFSCRSRANHL
jgi:hypothetical protein